MVKTFLENTIATLLAALILILVRFLVIPGPELIKAEYSYAETKGDGPIEKKLYPGDDVMFYGYSNPKHYSADQARCEYSVVDRILWFEKRLRAINVDAGGGGAEMKSSWAFEGCTKPEESQFGKWTLKCCFSNQG